MPDSEPFKFRALIVLLVLMLACAPTIGAGPSNIKGKDIKVIKIEVHKDTGQIVGVKLKKDSGPDEGATVVSPTTPGTLVGSMLFHKSSPGCVVIVAGGYAWQICW